MIPKTSVQLYSVREAASVDYERAIRTIADIGFCAVEPAGFPGYTAEKAAKLFKQLGLEAPSCHGALPVGENKNRIIDEALMLGIRAIITGCPPKFRDSMNTLDAVKETAALYTEAAAFAAPHGIGVGYHNHDWDLGAIDGKPAYRYFLDLTPTTVLWEADLFWVARAGINVVEFVKEIGARGKFLHFKDGQVKTNAAFIEAETADGKIMVSADKPFLPAGAGEVDLIGAARAAKHVEYAVVELDSYTGDMMTAIKQSYAFLTGKGIASGRK